MRIVEQEQPQIQQSPVPQIKIVTNMNSNLRNSKMQSPVQHPETSDSRNQEETPEALTHLKLLQKLFYAKRKQEDETSFRNFISHPEI